MIRRDGGSAGVLVLVTAAVLGAALMSALSDMGVAVRDRARAQTAADAAALAALDGGRTAASDLAAINSGTLVSFALESAPGGALAGSVTVVVRVGSATATARATDAVTEP